MCRALVLICTIPFNPHNKPTLQIRKLKPGKIKLPETTKLDESFISLNFHVIL